MEKIIPIPLYAEGTRVVQRFGPDMGQTGRVVGYSWSVDDPEKPGEMWYEVAPDADNEYDAQPEWFTEDQIEPFHYLHLYVIEYRDAWDQDNHDFKTMARSENGAVAKFFFKHQAHLSEVRIRKITRR